MSETSNSCNKNNINHRLTQLALLTKQSRFSMGNLPSPIRSKLFNRYGNIHYQVCVCAMQGYRANMEDSHLVQLSFQNHTQYSLFAIFDGHNGRKAAQYLSRHLITKLDELPTLSDNKQIENIILSMDEEFCQSDDGEHGSTIVFGIVKPIYHQFCAARTDSNESNISNKSSKTASTLSIGDSSDNNNNNNIERIKEYEIRIFWAGDSRAILIESSKLERSNNNNNSNKNKMCIPTFSELTKDHRPDNPSERVRIEVAKGVIINNRVDSKLAVSRAFGDCNLKNNKSLQFSKQRVTSLLECSTVRAHRGDQLFLFCDGLVEYLENDSLIKNLYHHIPQYQDPVYALGYLFDEILEGGSRDNMSAIIINFKDGTNYGLNGRHKTFLPGPLYMTRNDKKYVDAYLRNAKDFGHQDTPKLRRAAYREDLKFLRKYGIKGLTLQQQQYGKTEKCIIKEIEQVIKQIDHHDIINKKKQKKKKKKKEKKVIPLTQGDDIERRGGSTEVIEEEEGDGDDDGIEEIGCIQSMEQRKSTPPLSDGDEEIDDDDDDDEDDDVLLYNKKKEEIKNNNNNNHNNKPYIDRSLTITPLQRHNSMTLKTPSPKNGNVIEFKESSEEQQDIKENISPKQQDKTEKILGLNSRKRSFSNMNGGQNVNHNDDNDDDNNDDVDDDNNNDDNNNNSNNVELHESDILDKGDMVRFSASKRRKSNIGDAVKIHSK